MNNNNQTEPP